MKVTAEATDVITTIDGRPARVWKATTENGVPCLMFVARIAVPDDDARFDHAQFEAELKTMPAPREVATRDVFDMRHVLD